MNVEDDNKVEIDLSHRSGEGEGEDKKDEGNYNSGAQYNSGVELKNMQQKSFNEVDEAYQDPYAPGEGRTSDSKIVNADQQIRLEQIDVRQLEGAENMNIRSDEQQFAAGEEAFKGVVFQKSCCFGPACTIIRRIISVIGCLLAIPNVALDLAYIAKSSFYNKAFFVTLIVIVMLRIILVICSFQGYLFYQMSYKPMLSTSNFKEEEDNDYDDSSQVDQQQSQDEDGTKSRRYQAVRKQGMTLYLSMNSLMLLGTFRMLPTLFFAKEVATGYAIELIFNLFPTFLIQMFNNTDQPGLLTGVQSTSLAIKMFLILNFFVEIILCMWEITLNRKMRKLKIQGFEKITEEEKRRRFSRKYGLLGLSSALVWLVILIMILAIASGRQCDNRHAMESGVCVACIDPLCEDCLRDSQECKACPKDRNGTAYFLSESGQCRACDFGCQECVFDSESGSKCLQCHPSYYLSQNRYCKQCVNTGCLECADANMATGEQKCVNCDKGYYLSSRDDLCRKCYKGCAQCADDGSGGHQCMECEIGYYLSAKENQCMKCKAGCDKCEDDGQGGSKCITCSEGFRLDGGNCQDCSDDTSTSNCGVCDTSACIECRHGFYLDKSSGKPECKKCSDSLINCVECQMEGDKPKCLKCDTQIADLDSNGQCLKCKEGWTLDKDLNEKQQCMCYDILHTENGYQCKTCEQTIESCHTCQYSLEPEKKLQTFVGQWNKTHSGQKGNYGNREMHPEDAQHIICTKPGDGLVVVPLANGNEVFKKCSDVFKGCESCAELGLARTLSCDRCESQGWYKYRSGANNRCGQCIHIPNRPGMEQCEECNEFVCNKCKHGFHKLMGGCFKCYFDWQCNYFE